MVASKQLKFAMEADVERKARLEKMVATTQLRLALETEEERRAKKGMNLILISKTFFSQGMSSLALEWNHFSSYRQIRLYSLLLCN